MLESPRPNQRWYGEFTCARLSICLLDRSPSSTAEETKIYIDDSYYMPSHFSQRLQIGVT
eukprot:5388111-Amphidinium_carterae.1